MQKHLYFFIVDNLFLLCELDQLINLFLAIRLDLRAASGLDIAECG
jgi:hypothetical protein